MVAGVAEPLRRRRAFFSPANVVAIIPSKKSINMDLKLGMWIMAACETRLPGGNKLYVSKIRTV